MGLFTTAVLANGPSKYPAVLASASKENSKDTDPSKKDSGYVAGKSKADEAKKKYEVAEADVSRAESEMRAAENEESKADKNVEGTQKEFDQKRGVRAAALKKMKATGTPADQSAFEAANAEWELAAAKLDSAKVAQDLAKKKVAVAKGRWAIADDRRSLAQISLKLEDPKLSPKEKADLLSARGIYAENVQKDLSFQKPYEIELAALQKKFDASQETIQKKAEVALKKVAAARRAEGTTEAAKKGLLL